MSTSLFYHGFGIVGYSYVRTRIQRRRRDIHNIKEKVHYVVQYVKVKKSYNMDLFLDGFIACLSAENRHTLKRRFPDWNVENAMSFAKQILGLQILVSRTLRLWHGMFSIWPGI